MEMYLHSKEIEENLEYFNTYMEINLSSEKELKKLKKEDPTTSLALLKINIEKMDKKIDEYNEEEFEDVKDLDLDEVYLLYTYR